MPRITQIVIAAVALWIAGPTLVAQTPSIGPDGLTLTSPGSPDDFGRLVEVSGTRVLIAGRSELYVYDFGTGAWDPGPQGLDLLAGRAAVDVRDVALGGTVAQVVFTDTTGTDHNDSFTFDGNAWALAAEDDTPLSLGVAIGTHPLAPRVTAFGRLDANGDPETVLRVEGLGLGAPAPVELTWPDVAFTNMALGDGPAGAAEMHCVIAGNWDEGVRFFELVVIDDTGIMDAGAIGLQHSAVYWFNKTTMERMATAHGRILTGNPSLGEAASFVLGGMFIDSESYWYGAGHAVACDEEQAAVDVFGGINLIRPDSWTEESYPTSAVSPQSVADVGLDMPYLAVGVSGPQGHVEVRKVAAEAAFQYEAPGMSPGSPFFSDPNWVWEYGNTLPDATFKLAFQVYSTAPVAWLVIGLDRIDVPFKGGVLVPRPDVVVALPLTNPGTNTVDLTGTWPNLPGMEFTVYFQPWYLNYPGMALRSMATVSATQYWEY